MMISSLVQLMLGGRSNTQKLCVKDSNYCKKRVGSGRYGIRKSRVRVVRVGIIEQRLE